MSTCRRALGGFLLCENKTNHRQEISDSRPLIALHQKSAKNTTSDMRVITNAHPNQSRKLSLAANIIPTLLRKSLVVKNTLGDIFPKNVSRKSIRRISNHLSGLQNEKKSSKGIIMNVENVAHPICYKCIT